MTEQDIIAALNSPWNISFFIGQQPRDKIGIASESYEEGNWRDENIVARYLKQKLEEARTVAVDYATIEVWDESGHMTTVIIQEHEQALSWIEWYLTMLDAASAGQPFLWITREQSLAFLTIVTDMHNLWLGQ